MSRLSHSEIHMVHRIGWLRAAVLGANDGLMTRNRPSQRMPRMPSIPARYIQPAAPVYQVQPRPTWGVTE